jgi:hypothetical protein
MMLQYNLYLEYFIFIYFVLVTFWITVDGLIYEICVTKMESFGPVYNDIHQRKA